ncbi:MAG: SMC-Scp complex subunit ScpB [Acidobacteriota bacterium]
MNSDEPVPEEVIAEGSAPHDAQELADAFVAAPESAEPEPEPSIEPGEAEADSEDLEIEPEAEAASLPQQLDGPQLKHLVEALVFAAEKPVTVQRLRQLTRISDVKKIEAVLAEIAADYAERGIVLQTVSGGYQFRTATQFSSWVQQLVAGRPVRLTRAQLETLAIVAYRQPITRPEIDEIRGVDSSNTLRVLAERSLVRILGKKEEVGRPLLYGTTKEFLDFFSLSDLRELPTLREYSELTAESRQVMTAKLGDDTEQATGDTRQAPGAAAAEQGADVLAHAHDAEIPPEPADEPVDESISDSAPEA